MGFFNVKKKKYYMKEKRKNHTLRTTKTVALDYKYIMLVNAQHQMN